MFDGIIKSDTPYKPSSTQCGGGSNGGNDSGSSSEQELEME